MYEATAPTSLQQGCIVQGVYFFATDEDRDAVALTPACDFAQDKADYITFVALIPYLEMADGLAKTSWKKDMAAEGHAIPGKDKRGNLRRHVDELVRNVYPRFQWFEKVDEEHGPWVADFQIVATLPKEDASQLPLLARLAPQHLEQLPARYASYMGRIGVPDATKAEIDAAHASIFEHFFGQAPPDD